MKRFSFSIMLLMLTAIFVYGQSKNEIAVRKVLDEAVIAMKNKDVAKLSLIYANDYSFVSPSSGVMSNKSERLAAVKSGKPLEFLAYEDRKIRIYGNTAVVTTTVKSKYVGQESAQSKATMTMVKNDGLWQIVAGQATSMGIWQDSNTYKSKDLEGLKSLPIIWERYWNSHNMDSMGSMLREDVDFINVAGVWRKGRVAVVNDHKEKHQTMFKSSIWSTDSVKIMYIKPDVAIIHVGWGMSGDFERDGTARSPRHGIFTWIVGKKNGYWQLLAGHNVNIREPLQITK